MVLCVPGRVLQQFIVAKKFPLTDPPDNEHRSVMALLIIVCTVGGDTCV